LDQIRRKNNESLFYLFAAPGGSGPGKPERDLKQSSSIILQYNYCKSPGQTDPARANIKGKNNGYHGLV